jgi:hypothetical protein
MARRNKTRKYRKSRNIMNTSVDKSVSIIKSTSRRYMPKVKSGLESVGSKVIKRSKETVPYLQRLTRKFFSAFSKKRR